MPCYYWRDRPKNVGWENARKPNQSLGHVRFRASTQPTVMNYFSWVTPLHYDKRAMSVVPDVPWHVWNNQDEPIQRTKR
ncbi:hypothetical protein [Coleofasciculus sp. G2-EDA-02]|uniref:hypothetical protein n=1 Tax=Coleofasciculus sp. G2-EDA-02 TaxID=3069529 RepID=UPI0033004581